MHVKECHLPLDDSCAMKYCFHRRHKNTYKHTTLSNFSTMQIRLVLSPLVRRYKLWQSMMNNFEKKKEQIPIIFRRHNRIRLLEYVRNRLTQIQFRQSGKLSKFSWNCT